MNENVESATYYKVEQAVYENCGDDAHEIVLALGAVRQLIHEWQLAPTLRSLEIDMQADLAMKLQQRFASINRGTINARHTSYNDLQPFSRVSMEAYVKPVDNEPRNKTDIVVWGGSENEAALINGGDYPILIACEIKWKTNFNELRDNLGDKTRLMKLLAQGKAKCGCCLQMLGLPKSSDDIQIEWACKQYKDAVMVVCTGTTLKMWGENRNAFSNFDVLEPS